jgi:O-antigen ligase
VSSTILTSSRLKLPTPAGERSLSPETKILYSVFTVLALATLAFGAVEAWSIFMVEVVAALLFVQWFRLQLRAPEFVLRWNPLYAPMAAFAGIVLLQLVLGATAYWHDTFSSALLYAAYAMLALVASQTLRRSSQAKTLGLGLTAFGGFIALFALLQNLASNGKLYWLRTPRNGGWIYGPYVNHNHYAGLMELLVPVPLVLCQTRFAQGWVRNAAIGIAALMTGTIFLSGSRGGMLAFLVELAFLGILALRTWRTSRGTTSLAVFLALAIGLLVWIGGGEVAKRIKTIQSDTRTELSGGTRLSLNKDSLHMAAKRPILGWGLGNFPIAYPQFRSFYTNLFVNAAHNDYLQLLVETGLAGLAAMFWFLVVVYRYGLRKLENWTSDIGGAIAAVCLTGVTGILVHSFVDFNLQVTANAAWFYVFCALAASTTTIEARQRVRRARNHNLPDRPFPEAPASELS